MTSLQKN